MPSVPALLYLAPPPSGFWKRKDMKMNKILMILLLTVMGACASAASGGDCLWGDCVNGFGKMKFETGSIYEGIFKDGQRHGFARMSEMDGSYTLGYWADNEITEGIYVYPDGKRYLGQWKYRERNGAGILVEPDGSRYLGEFSSGRRHGWGMLVFADDRKYIGEFNRGVRDGWGTMTFPDGRRYVGQFTNGARTGQGTMIFPDGRALGGQFIDGQLQTP
jgi:hypothetical protein